MADDDSPLTADDVEAAASVGRLPALARQLVLDGSWASLDVVLRYARDAALPLGELEETIRTIATTIGGLSDSRRAAAAEEIRALKRQAAFTLLRRLDRQPLTGPERTALVVAATLLVDLGELERAAATFERAGDELRAAEAYGALGDLDRMEACLARDEAIRSRRQLLAEARRQFETRLAAGERRAALAVLRPVRDDDFDAHGLLAQGRQIERRLCRGRAVTLQPRGGLPVRFAALPATLGRDGSCEVVLRDPGVSRRHSRLAVAGQTFTVADLGSRGGTRIAGAAIRAEVPLPGDGIIVLGEHARLQLTPQGPGLLQIIGSAGLDRSLRAYVAAGAVPLALAFPDAQGLALLFDGDGPRLLRDPAVPVRVDGQLIGPSCDLLAGDRIEVGSAPPIEVL